MIQQITKGIKISVETEYEGNFLKDNAPHYAFLCKTQIENQSKSSVQLLTRHWKIIEALNKTQYIIGSGVVGKIVL
tara:strand:- start:13589 stop:13816 length:228 start_codon:yes stop_codon:yes gene_type:complete